MKKITRRLFNTIAASTAFLFGRKAKADPIDEFCAAEEAKDAATDYMEVLILPEPKRYKKGRGYDDKIKAVHENHIDSGTPAYKIKENILKRAKVIRIPLKDD